MPTDREGFAPRSVLLGSPTIRLPLMPTPPCTLCPVPGPTGLLLSHLQALGVSQMNKGCLQTRESR